MFINFNLFKAEANHTIKLAIPIVIGQLGIMLMGVADTIQVGHMRHLAKEAVGAAGIANGIYITIAIIGIIALQIVAPMISQAKASNDTQRINNLYRSAIKVAIFLSILIIVLIEIVSMNLHILKQKPIVEQLAKSYLNIIAFSAIPMLLFTAIKQLCDGLSQTKIAMQITLSAVLLNVLLNHVLINGIWFFPELGLNGAGIATLLARIYMMLGLYFYISKKSTFRKYLNKIENGKENLIKQILKIGIPSGLQGFFEIAVFSAAAIVVGQIGANELAAHQVAINPASVTYMMVSGLAAAGGIRVGGFLGSNDISGVKKAGTVSLLIGFAFMFFCFCLLYFFPKLISSFYINDVEVLPLAASLLSIAAFFQLSDGIQAVALGILRGIADVNIPTVVTLFAYWVVGFPIGYYLAFNKNMGVIGIWVGLSLGLTASAILLTWRFYYQVSKLQKKANIAIGLKK